MFAKSIVLSDVFLDMPLSARCLYFTLGMLADDDGFVGNPKAIMRQCGASQDDMAVLLQKRYILAFESGVIVIKHWRMNNYLQNDRHKPTTYLEELETLEIDKKGAYTEKDKMYTKCIQNVYTDKDSIDKDSIDNIYLVDFEAVWKLYPKKQGKENAKKSYLKARKEGVSQEDIIKGIEKYIAQIKRQKTETRYIKHGSTWFNQRCWEDEYDTSGRNNTIDGEDTRPYADQEDDDWFFNRK